MNWKTNKKGSIIVLISMFFVTLMMLISACINVSKTLAIQSGANAVGNLIGESVLAEYDLNLYKRYNLMGFYGQTWDVKDKLDFYCSKTFKGKNYISCGESNVSLYDYSLANVKAFRKQIVKNGKYTLSDKYEKPQGNITCVMPNGKCSENTASIMSSLPSGGAGNYLSITEVADSIKQLKNLNTLINESGSRYFENRYIECYFKSFDNDKNLGETFLNNEIEYIICGKSDDNANAESIKLKIIGVRELLNISYLYKNSKMLGETAAAAEVLTPGPAAAATQQALIAAWALAESSNDYKLLVRGHKIPIIKTERTWAVDLESIIENNEKDCIYTGTDVGEDYAAYLNVFLYLMDENTKLLRVMDLIQMNNRYLYYDSFLIKNYNTGLEYSIDVNGKKHSYKKAY